uniref:Uncharacterized protein n=1 Tax=Arundo donax TaxID=35708 RepID=A0A0A9AZB8_ARUDO
MLHALNVDSTFYFIVSSM